MGECKIAAFSGSWFSKTIYRILETNAADRPPFSWPLLRQVLARKAPICAKKRRIYPFGQSFFVNRTFRLHIWGESVMESPDEESPQRAGPKKTGTTPTG
jgi:hypothetical protein